MSRSTILRLTLAAVLMLLVAEIAFVDAWHISGQVRDRQSGLPVPGAQVLISVTGNKLKLPWPHAPGGGSACIRSFLAEVNKDGEFSVWAIGLSPYLTDKEGTFEVFHPGWYQQSPAFQPISSGFLDRSASVKLTLEKDVGTRWSFGYHNTGLAPLSSDPETDAYQQTLSKSLSEQASIVGSGSLCDGEGWPLLITVLRHVANRAETIDERRFIVMRCEAMRRKGAYLSQKRGAFGSPAKKLKFPFVCNQSLFDRSENSHEPRLTSENQREI